MTTERKSSQSWLSSAPSRRRFLQVSGTAAAAATVLSKIPLVKANPSTPDKWTATPTVLRSGCMMCNAGCGIQVKVVDGVAVKIDGNPYCPQANSYTSALDDVKVTDIAKPDVTPGALCSRGMAGLMTLYDPLRLRSPLKRTGPRGSGQWKTITWEEAINEIVWGGMLPDGPFEGLAAIRNVTSKFTSADTAYAAEAKAGDPANYGFKSNQLVMMVGRDQTGEATGRFMAAFGSINRLDHTSLCNASYKVAGYLTFVKENAEKGQYDFKPDVDASDYLVFFGTNPLEANTTNPFIRKLAAFKKRGGKLVVIDPRFTNSAAKADWWIGKLKPGTDAALALGVCRWLIDNNKHKTGYLRRSHKGAPNPDASTGFTDLTYLVNPATKKFMTAKDAGLGKFVAKIAGTGEVISSSVATLTLTLDANDVDGNPLDLSKWPTAGNVKIGSELFYYSGKSDTAKTLTISARKCKGTKASAHLAGAEVTIPYVVTRGGTTLGYHEPAGDASNLPDLEFSGTVNSVAVTTAFTALKTSLDTVDNYATACGVAATDIARLGTELSTATAPCVDMYRGALAHTNGTYNIRSIYLINILLDRIDRKGGYCLGKRYKAGTPAHPGAPASAGVRIDRANAKYEGTAASPTRPWYPLAFTGVQQEVLPSIKIGYPYPIKALITFTSNPAYSTPFTRGSIDALLDRKAVPLHVAVDVILSETSALADYVLPDVTYLEKWTNNVQTGYATVHTPSGVIRRPVVGKLDPTTKVYHPVLPNTKSMDDILIMLGRELGLPGYGKDGMGAGKDLYTAYQYYNEMYKSGDFAMPTGLEDSTHEILVMGGKRKNPATIYDASGNFILDAAKYANFASVYSEWMASYKHSYTGQAFQPLPVFEPPRKDVRGAAIVSPSTLNLTMTGGKLVQHVQSRSTSNSWLREIDPDPGVQINPADAAARGITQGALVRVRGRVWSAVGKARLTESVPAGSIGVPHHFGRWAHGSRPMWVDGEQQPHDAAVGAGVAQNTLIEPDPVLGDVCPTDPIGGSVENYSSKVAVELA